MTTAAYLLVYGALVTWVAPRPLAGLTRGGMSPRLGIAAWLTAVACVLVAWIAALALIVVTTLRSFPDSPVIVVCLELLGVSERVATPGRLSLAALIVGGIVVSTAVAVSFIRTLHALRLRSREHAQAARLIGSPTGRADVVVVTAEQPAAYCVAGRPNAIVVTTAAIETLDEMQLAAVLAHEDAHISGRHHQLLIVLSALSSSLRWLPLFARARAEVADLLEMCADDSAAGVHGVRPLITGMALLAGSAPHPAAALAIASNAVLARADRLLHPERGAACWCHRLLVASFIALMVSAPAIANSLCHH